MKRRDKRIHRNKRVEEHDFLAIRGRFIYDERENQNTTRDKLMKNIQIRKFKGANDSKA